MKHHFYAGLLCAGLLLTRGVALAAEEIRVFAAGRAELAVLECRENTWQKSASFPLTRPMYLVRGKTLFCALAASAVQEWSEEQEKLLVPGTVISSGGKSCCHLSLSASGKTLYGANYSGGNVFALRLPGELHLLQHQGGQKGSRRQEAPHPHYAAPLPDGSALAVCDLGLDRVILYPLKDELPQVSGKTEIALPPGSGPRHLLFAPSGKTMYVGNELNSTVCVFQHRENSWQLLQTLPATQAPPARRNFPGAIRFSENGRFVFLTNRGADTVTVFSRQPDDSLKRNGEFACAAYPSDLLQSGDLLLIACLKGNCVEIRKFDPDSGDVSPKLQSLSLPGALALCR